MAWLLLIVVVILWDSYNASSHGKYWRYDGGAFESYGFAFSTFH